jgi:hypothetical protein
MTDIVVAIVFGGASSEHKESIRAAQILYREAIRGKLDLMNGPVARIHGELLQNNKKSKAKME